MKPNPKRATGIVSFDLVHPPIPDTRTLTERRLVRAMTILFRIAELAIYAVVFAILALYLLAVVQAVIGGGKQ